LGLLQNDPNSPAAFLMIENATSVALLNTLPPGKILVFSVSGKILPEFSICIKPGIGPCLCQIANGSVSNPSSVTPTRESGFV
jgi:hypothetical protein